MDKHYAPKRPHVEARPRTTTVDPVAEFELEYDGSPDVSNCRVSE